MKSARSVTLVRVEITYTPNSDSATLGTRGKLIREQFQFCDQFGHIFGLVMAINTKKRPNPIKILGWQLWIPKGQMDAGMRRKLIQHILRNLAQSEIWARTDIHTVFSKCGWSDLSELRTNFTSSMAEQIIVSVFSSTNVWESMDPTPRLAVTTI